MKCIWITCRASLIFLQIFTDLEKRIRFIDKYDFIRSSKEKPQDLYDSLTILYEFWKRDFISMNDSLISFSPWEHAWKETNHQYWNLAVLSWRMEYDFWKENHRIDWYDFRNGLLRILKGNFILMNHLLETILLILLTCEN